MSVQVVFQPPLTEEPETLELFSVAPVAGSAILLFVFFIRRLLQHRQEKTARYFSLAHILINILAILGVGALSIISAFQAFCYQAKLAAGISTAICVSFRG